MIYIISWNHSRILKFLSQTKFVVIHQIQKDMDAINCILSEKIKKMHCKIKMIKNEKRMYEGTCLAPTKTKESNFNFCYSSICIMLYVLQILYNTYNYKCVVKHNSLIFDYF